MSDGSQQEVYVLVVFDPYEDERVDEVVGPFTDERDADNLSASFHHGIPSQVVKLTAPGNERTLKRKHK